MLIARWASLGGWSNTFSWVLPPACFLHPPLPRMPAAIPLSCLITLTESLCSTLWIKAEEEEEVCLAAVLLADSLWGERWLGERACTHRTIYVCMYTGESEGPGKFIAGVTSAVCCLRNHVVFSDNQWLLCFSKNYKWNWFRRFWTGGWQDMMFIRVQSLEVSHF